MAAVTVTAAQVGAVYPDHAEIYPAIAGATFSPGQAAYYNTSGNAVATAAGTTAANAFHGLVMGTAGSGQGVSLLRRGMVYGFGLSNVAYGGTVYAGTAVNTFDDSAVGGTVIVGICVPLSDTDRTKVLYVNATWR